MGDFYIIQPAFFFWERRCNAINGKSLPDDFEYNSGTNPWFLSIEEMKELIRGLQIGDRRP